MESSKKIEAACRRSGEAAIKHVEATEAGNYAQANKSYQVVAKNTRYLKEANNLKQLSKLLYSESVGVRMWAITYLLPIFERNATQILRGIASGNNIYSLTAKMTIDEREKGTLVLQLSNTTNGSYQNNHLIIILIFKRLSIEAGINSLPFTIFIV